MTEWQTEHRKLHSVFSVHFPITKLCSCSVAKSAYQYTTGTYWSFGGFHKFCLVQESIN